MIRPALLVLGATVIAASAVHSANAAHTVPTSRNVLVDLNRQYSLRVHKDSFAPLVTQLPGQSASQAAETQLAIAQQGGSAMGSETLLLCNTIDSTDNPYAVFLLGSVRIYATLGTPVGSLRVHAINLGSVTFDDGSAIAQTNCSANLPAPDVSLKSGTAYGQGADAIVPSPIMSPPNSVPAPAAPMSTQPLATPTPIVNPYSTPLNQQPTSNNPYVINTRPTP